MSFVAFEAQLLDALEAGPWTWHCHARSTVGSTFSLTGSLAYRLTGPSNDAMPIEDEVLNPTRSMPISYLWSEQIARELHVSTLDDKSDNVVIKARAYYYGSEVCKEQIKPFRQIKCWDVQAITDQMVLRLQGLITLWSGRHTTSQKTEKLTVVFILVHPALLYQ